jgi:hypothetical protein
VLIIAPSGRLGRAEARAVFGVISGAGVPVLLAISAVWPASALTTQCGGNGWRPADGNPLRRLGDSLNGCHRN